MKRLREDSHVHPCPGGPGTNLGGAPALVSVAQGLWTHVDSCCLVSEDCPGRGAAVAGGTGSQRLAGRGSCGKARAATLWRCWPLAVPACSLEPGFLGRCLRDGKGAEQRGPWEPPLQPARVLHFSPLKTGVQHETALESAVLPEAGHLCRGLAVSRCPGGARWHHLGTLKCSDA